MRMHQAGILFLVGLASVAGAQSAPSTRAAAKEGKPWKFSSRFDLGAEYDNNVFLLSASKKDNPGDPSSADVASGRYADMTNSSDVITTIVATFEAEGSGLAGRNITLAPSVSYDWYGRNSARSNATIGINVSQAMPHDGRLRLRGRLQPSYFARNYLIDAVDGDASGSITAEERVYARGEYRDTDVQLDYRHRLAKATKNHPFGAFLVVGGGFADRSNDAPFGARDLSGATGTARLQFDIGRRVELETMYDLGVLGSSRSRQVVLVDETAFGEDLNGNGSFVDPDVRVTATVDRSRTEHVVGQRIGFEAGKDTDVDLTVDYRWRRFSSDERYDVANNGRRDRRGRYGMELTHRFTRAVRGVAGGRYSSQTLNRRTDLGGESEIDDYSKFVAHLGVRISR